MAYSTLRSGTPPKIKPEEAPELLKCPSRVQVTLWTGKKIHSFLREWGRFEPVYLRANSRNLNPPKHL